jgi:hypothetical protein
MKLLDIGRVGSQDMPGRAGRVRPLPDWCYSSPYPSLVTAVSAQISGDDAASVAVADPV